MASRDDYPGLKVWAGSGFGRDARECVEALDEIDRLRAELERWKERAEDYRRGYWELRAMRWQVR